jgi:hypothetical protein
MVYSGIIVHKQEREMSHKIKHGKKGITLKSFTDPYGNPFT